uniref:Uncharacterized protein n=1 Tax=viral metagenome TaxID=1070528 RepID=A0A6C0AES4_9ZZZZ
MFFFEPTFGSEKYLRNINTNLKIKILLKFLYELKVNIKTWTNYFDYMN